MREKNPFKKYYTKNCIIDMEHDIYIQSQIYILSVCHERVRWSAQCSSLRAIVELPQYLLTLHYLISVLVLSWKKTLLHPWLVAGTLEKHTMDMHAIVFFIFLLIYEGRSSEIKQWAVSWKGYSVIAIRLVSLISISNQSWDFFSSCA